MSRNEKVTTYKEALKITFELNNEKDESGRYISRSQAILVAAIGQDFFDQLSILGFIKCGVAVLPIQEVVPTWSMTQAGIDEYYFFHPAPIAIEAIRNDPDYKLASLLVDLSA